jgi:hypothetical protein
MPRGSKGDKRPDVIGNAVRVMRIISVGALVMFAAAIGIATFDPTYAANPCCGYRNSVYINLKTGKPARPPKAAHSPDSLTGAKPATPSAPDPGVYK